MRVKLVGHKTFGTLKRVFAQGEHEVSNEEGEQLLTYVTDEGDPVFVQVEEPDEAEAVGLPSKKPTKTIVLGKRAVAAPPSEPEGDKGGDGKGDGVAEV